MPRVARALLATLLGAGVLVLGAPGAGADDVTDFSLSPSSGYAGSSFTAIGGDFPACVGAKPGQGVRKFWWDAVGGTLLGSVSGDLPAFSVGLTVPAGASAGGHSVIAHCSWDGFWASAGYTVLYVPPPPPSKPPPATTTTASSTTTAPPGSTAPPPGTTSPPPGSTSPTTAAVSPPGTTGPGGATTDPPATGSGVTNPTAPPGNDGGTTGTTGAVVTDGGTTGTGAESGGGTTSGGDGESSASGGGDEEGDGGSTTTGEGGGESREASGRPGVAPRPQPKPGELVLGVSAVTPGAGTTVAGAGCRAGSAVVVEAEGTEIGRATAGGDGRFEADVAVGDLAPGRYEMEARCGARLVGLFDVVLASSSTAATSSLAVLAFFVLVGAGVWLLRRAIG